MIQGPDFDPLDDFTSLHALSTALVEVQLNQSSMMKRLDNLKVSPTSCESTKKTFLVNMGRHTSDSMSDFGAYVESFLLPHLPFGPFICIYSFLERVTSFKVITSDTELKDMEVRKNLDLKADEALVIESFKHPLPLVFHNGSQSISTTTWLPGVPLKDKWEDKHCLSGAKVTIKENIEVI